VPARPAVKRRQLLAACDPHAALLVRFDGARLLDANGQTLAELAADGRWYTSDGKVVHGLSEAPEPLRDAATIERDADWMREAVAIITEIAETRQYLTSDDVWALAETEPSESRMMGNALVRAQHAGVISPTPEHRPSRRPENHGRPVRVWCSLWHGNQ
jgi:hypothetical protein